MIFRFFWRSDSFDLGSGGGTPAKPKPKGKSKAKAKASDKDALKVKLEGKTLDEKKNALRASLSRIRSI